MCSIWPLLLEFMQDNGGSKEALASAPHGLLVHSSVMNSDTTADRLRSS